MAKRYEMLTDGVLSRAAATAFEYGLNPDVEELMRYNREALQRACAHPRAETIEGEPGYPGHRFCPDCGAR